MVAHSEDLERLEDSGVFEGRPRFEFDDDNVLGDLLEVGQVVFYVLLVGLLELLGRSPDSHIGLLVEIRHDGDATTVSALLDFVEVVYFYVFGDKLNHKTLTK